MKLAAFIVGNIEPILQHWEEFAQSLFPETMRMSPSALRDHAEEILRAIVADLQASQTKEEQRQKSLGRAPKVWHAPETKAQTHAVLQALWQFVCPRPP